MIGLSFLCGSLSAGPGPAEPHVGRSAARSAGGHRGGSAACHPRSAQRKRDAVRVQNSEGDIHLSLSINLMFRLKQAQNVSY